MCFSLLCKSTKNESVSIFASNNAVQMASIYLTPELKLYTIFFIVPYNSPDLVLGIRFNQTQDTVDIYGAKLEFGNTSTLAYKQNETWYFYEIPNYTDLLLRCQRYFFSTGYLTGMTGTSSAYGKYFTSIVTTPVTMRMSPTVIANHIVMRYNGQDYDNNIVANSGDLLGNGIRITVNFPDSTNNIIRQVIGWFTDESGIQFSADL